MFRDCFQRCMLIKEILISTDRIICQVVLEIIIKLTSSNYNLLFFLVFCLPRQVNTSNGVVHHNVQLSPSTCCLHLSSSSPVTSFSVFLFSFLLPFFPRTCMVLIY